MSAKAKSCKDMPLMGSTTVGERGQIVIPKNIRDTLHLQPGAQLLVMQHRDAIVLLPIEHMQSVIQTMTQQLDQLKPSK